MDEEEPIEEILDTIGDKEARRVLASISQEARSAKELADQLDLSLPTVYRRLELLQEHDLAKSQTLVGENGNHYKVFECNFDATVISLDDDVYNVRIYRTDNLPDRFTSLWDELGVE
jgi:DNA-binding transcriptional ArsR family regulator